MNAQFWQTPPTFSAIQQEIYRIAADFHSVRLFSAGKSLCGREISALCMGNPGKAVLYAGGIHGQEWLTTLLLLRFARKFAGIFPAEPKLPAGLLILPLLNPDGMEIALHGAETAGIYTPLVREIQAENPALWQANARGVDLNHNFNAGWPVLRAMEIEAGILSPAPTRFGGISAESEPETRAAVHLIRKYKPRRLYAFHSQGEEIFWQYGKTDVPHAEALAHTLAELSGYTLVENDGLASHGGMKDWFIETFRRPGFTVEIGKGKNPLPPEQLEPIYRRLLPMLAAGVFL